MKFLKRTDNKTDRKLGLLNLFSRLILFFLNFGFFFLQMDGSIVTLFSLYNVCPPHLGDHTHFSL